MATHSSTLAWKIPCMEKPDRLQSLGSQRVGHRVMISQTGSWKLRKLGGVNDASFGCFLSFSVFCVGVLPDILEIPRNLEAAVSHAIVTATASWAVVTP